MPDLVITPADVGIGDTVVDSFNGVPGGAIVQATPVYINAVGTWINFNATEDIGDRQFGIAVTKGLADGGVIVITKGKVLLSAVMTQGIAYVVSATGGIAPESDLVATNWVYRLGTAESTSILDCVINNTRIQK